MRIRIQSAGLVFFTLILCFSLQVQAQEGTDEKAYYKNYQSILQIMKKGMEEAPVTGDPSLDFLYEMIPHHKAAVSMAEDISKYSHNPRIKQLAVNIIRDQLAGIKRMETLKKQLQKNPQVNKQAEKAYLKAYHAIYQTMIASMEAAKPTGNVDKDFLEEMIPHHEGAIQMAQNILKYTQNKELKSILENIITTQKNQLKEMKTLLKDMQ